MRLLSDIGGVLGLWAGISIIALIETVAFFIQLINASVISKTKTNSPSTQTKKNSLDMPTFLMLKKIVKNNFLIKKCQ